MRMSKEESREKFEKHVTENHLILEEELELDDDGFYINWLTEALWRTWSAGAVADEL